MSVNYTIALNIECIKANETDDTAEFYGAVQYRTDGKGDWIPFASTTDSNPWVVGRTASSTVRVGTQNVILPESATTVNFQTKLYEYDPTVFDADEDLDYIEFAVPLPSGKRIESSFLGTMPETSTRREFKQGSSSTAVAGWAVNIDRVGS
jgi:hypothetical protein